MKACYDIVGIPECDIAELQGGVHAARRKKLWPQSRIVFCTPQTFVNDLSHNRVGDPRKIVCLVIDEAHRATGDYAYCKAVRKLTCDKSHHRFRILALSATPGKDLGAVQNVVDNLNISHLEIRLPDDPDVKKHAFETIEEERIVKDSPVMKRLIGRVHDLMRPIMAHLKHTYNITCGHSTNAAAVQSYSCTTAMQYVIGSRGRYSDPWTIVDNIRLLGRLARVRDMLQKYGVSTLFEVLKEMKEGENCDCRDRQFAAWCSPLLPSIFISSLQIQGNNEKGMPSTAVKRLIRTPAFATLVYVDVDHVDRPESDNLHDVLHAVRLTCD